MSDTRRHGPAPGDSRCIEGGRRGGLRNVENGVDFRKLGQLGGLASLKRYGKDGLIENLRENRKDAGDAKT